MDLTLPKIEPARTYTGGGDAIDRAGASFKQATDKVANVLSETEKSRIVVEHQEATLQATKGLNDTLQTIQTQPYVTPERVQQMFGGKVPENIDLTEQVPGQPDEKVRQPRKVIPMHEVAPAVFEHQSKTVVADAARNVTDEPWRRHFERAVASDVERKRAEMMDWQKAQFLADMEIRSVSQFSQAMAARNYPLAEAILNGPGLGVKAREELRASMPAMRTKAVVEDRLRAARTPQELDKLLTDISGNSIGDGSDQYAKLTPEQQYQFSVTATHRKHELVNEQIAARKQAREGLFQKYGNIAFEALKLSQQTGQPASKFWSIAQISADDNAGMDFNDKMVLLNALNADPKRPDEPGALLELNTIWRKPGALGKLSPQTMWGYGPRLSAERWREWLDRWSKDKVEPGTVKSPITEAQDNLAGRYVSVFLNTDAKDKPQEYELKKSRIVQMMIDNALSKSPKPMFTIADVADMAAGRFDESKQKSTGDMVLRSGLAYLEGGAGRVTDQTIARHKKLIKDEAPLVDEAYKALVADETPSDEWRARVHVVLANPVNLQTVKEQLRSEGKNPEDKRAQVLRITKDMRPKESEDYARGVEEDATKARAREQVRLEAEKQRAEEKAAQDARRAAEETRRRALPVWESYAEDFQVSEAKRRVEMKRWELHQQIGKDPIDNTPFQVRLGGLPPDYGRADAEVERQRPEIEKQVAAEFDANKRAFREFLKAVEANDPAAVALARKFYIDNTGHSFKKFSELRQKGEIP